MNERTSGGGHSVANLQIFGIGTVSTPEKRESGFDLKQPRGETRSETICAKTKAQRELPHS